MAGGNRFGAACWLPTKNLGRLFGFFASAFFSHKLAAQKSRLTSALLHALFVEIEKKKNKDKGIAA